MMAASRHPDPYIHPALERLSKQKPRPIIGALSNTVIYPPDQYVASSIFLLTFEQDQFTYGMSRGFIYCTQSFVVLMSHPREV